jgi:hypothetical protein
MAKKSKVVEVAVETTPVEETPAEVTKAVYDPKAMWTPEKRAQLAEKMKEYWANNAHPLKGKKLSEETVAKIREAQLARGAQGPMSDAQKEAIRTSTSEYWKTHEHPNKGKPMTDEVKAKIRAAHIARRDALKAQVEEVTTPAE